MGIIRFANDTISDCEKSKKRVAEIRRANRHHREHFAKSFRENQKRINDVRKRMDNYSK